ncbi:MAG: polyprenyl synthetase [Verrucomicrobia bacterium CG_4_10_14_3_um_filter_43_23]|nr:MAG: polyprenyl synthetase [Verrucomicrobia bacterium CG22_combo_CG10-13_8_21_14_all_43_17]PIX58320.1 MAG: polyprenyl synthetase [Verrucomicrobia bacterium CG_4_10_14_3_um_filter_43_23]PIY60847.1 MAG: polyprenyl synthetase [Verrucomicrobia bacterium CG_4_10_14_0_8_um_filter_43_34]PJA44337.1 MAG: polyprenyl synthetase [Verrucomicrobia bacterium CG_4_9_14_3_um_filter_43_20]
MANASLVANSPTKLSFTDIIGSIEPHFKALDHFLSAQTNEIEPELHELAQYCINLSGKRIRASLVFLSGWTSDNIVSSDLVHIAAIIELVHLATLVHDDILDKAFIRRNKATLSQKFGNNEAILFGDALFSHSLKIASDFPTTLVCRSIAEATRRVCAGEIAQTFFKNNTPISLTQYYRIIDLKTAELFRVACALGATFSSDNQAFHEAAANFGRSLGIAYQIYDDLIDFFGEEDTIGKTLGTDLNERRYTLPVILLMENVAPEDRKQLQTLLASQENCFEHVKALMDKHQIKDAVVQSLSQELETAEASLKPFEALPAVPKLLAIKAFLLQKVQDL